MACHLTKRFGGGVSNPSVADLQSALEELEVEDPEHPDCWLEDEHGWCLSAFGNGLLILVPRAFVRLHVLMRGVSRAKVLELWELLKTGKLTEIREHGWQLGYDSQSKVES
jgi:hypothetical protein